MVKRIMELESKELESKVKQRERQEKKEKK